jgi:hypothetical protein
MTQYSLVDVYISEKHPTCTFMADANILWLEGKRALFRRLHMTLFSQ